ncbi:MAG: septum site-determining protein MinD [Pyrococcus sp.]|nr:septum site-determining protein MinD [Pyrococcus sp.]
MKPSQKKGEKYLICYGNTKIGKLYTSMMEGQTLEGRSIVFASGKGGTGKTTTVANIGVALAQFGKDVILIDADITMANLSLILGMEDIPITLHDVLAGEAELKDAIYEGPAGVKVIPGGLSLEKVKKARPERLRELIREISQMGDFILIDAPAGLELTSVTALLIGKELIVDTVRISGRALGLSF